MANLSKIRRDKMIQFLETLKEQHSDDESLIAINQIEKELASKRYGLIWEEHEENVDVMMRDNIPVFTEVSEREIAEAPEKNYNFLLEGDNLHSLHLLEKTHKGKVDVIYIDPPYNTGGKDFKYDDTFIDEKDGFRHSKWLSFMYERLIVSKKLLKESGVIFISIDDNEVSQLKLLCDEIFGVNNFVGMILWKKKTNGNNMGWLPAVHDYIVCYSKSIDNVFDLGYELSEEDILEKYSNPDDDPRGPWVTTDLSANHVGPYFPVTNPKTGDVFYPPDGRYWVFNENEVKKRIDDGRIIFGKSGIARPVQRVFARDREMTKRKAESWWDKQAMNADATQELKDIFGVAKIFTHPKPSKLIQNIIKISCEKDGIILDFFAGSGTTAQAVLELNKQDGGNRKFVLCTNNENNICRDVTYQRIKTVITGKRKDGTEYSEGIPANLKYYRTDFVSKEEEFLADALLEHTAEMIQLEHGIKIDNRQYVMLMSDEEADELESHWDEYSDIKAIYVSQNVLLTTTQETLFGTVDIHTIPNYYFNSELREAGQLW
ncbi:site-specific DNA-methyltransferase [Lachnospiraceae bacterium]|jgi:adenine-specific DNA-methyltransferase|nr:site-specific DNA-methyltransferase [Lachnospiraceae bacterium]